MGYGSQMHNMILGLIQKFRTGAAQPLRSVWSSGKTDSRRDVKIQSFG